MINKIFPFLLWFKDYNIDKLKIDSLSGLTVALVLIPGTSKDDLEDSLKTRVKLSPPSRFIITSSDRQYQGLWKTFDGLLNMYILSCYLLQNIYTDILTDYFHL